MRIIFIGDFSEKLDEGFKNTSHYLARELEGENSIIKVNIKKPWNLYKHWKSTRTKQDIIHTIAQPTYHSFIFTFLVNIIIPEAHTVISALRSENFLKDSFSILERKFINIIKPDLILVQNHEAEVGFTNLSCNTVRLPNGVDLDKFKPVSPSQKALLRKKYNLSLSKQIFLHVGHLFTRRNLTALKSLVDADTQVVIVGSDYLEIDQTLFNDLASFGIVIIKGYQPLVEELYQLADCYIFPTLPGNSLSMPLSVIEAMACNLPVITTRFKSLENVFDEDNGLYFIDSQDDLPSAIVKLKSNTEMVNTRKLVENMSWRSISIQLQKIYMELLDE
jgi:glycosyltransferase involved in cell wall biosynthesis